MQTIFSIICAVVTIFMAMLHLALLFGAPIGQYVLGGKDKIIPKSKRWVNALFVFLFTFLFLVYFSTANIIGFALPVIATKIIMWVYTAFLAYAIIGNTFLTSSKKEKLLMIPASTIGFISSLITVLSI